MGAYDTVADFLATKWRDFESVLINPPSFARAIEDMARSVAEMRRSAESPNQIQTARDVYGVLAARQLDYFMRLCYRDGFAPILSTVVYTIERDLYDMLVSAGVSKAERAEMQQELLETTTFLAYEYNWTVYLHTLVTLQRIKRAVTKYGPAIGAARWAREVDKLISTCLANIGAVLPFTIPLRWLIEGNIPIRLDDDAYFKIHKIVRELWVALSGIAKVGFLPPAPVPETEVHQFYADFTEGALRAIQERLTQTYHLPVIDEPLRVVVVYGEEARYTQSVAFFRETSKGMEIYIFKPPDAPFNPAQEIHLLFHEGVPGHAYLAHNHRKVGAPLPVDDALRLTSLSGLAFIDTYSVFHEGWAVFAQRLGAELTESEDIKRYFFVELLSYLERFLVLENIIPLYTVKPHIPRFAEPFQFSSYFVGYLLWEMCAERDGMRGVWQRASQGVFPYHPTGKELVGVLERLLRAAIAQKTKEKEQQLAKSRVVMRAWDCYTKS